VQRGYNKGLGLEPLYAEDGPARIGSQNGTPDSSSAGLILAKQDVENMAKKSLKVDREKFEGVVKSLLKTPPLKREDVRVAKKKPEKLIPPQK
jgi:bacterioferritin (cytochrome b1)